MNNNAENNGLCTEACLLGHCQAESPMGLGLGLELSYTIKINRLRSNRIRRNQLVVTVSEINRFYIQCKDLLLQHHMKCLSFTI